MSLSECKDFVGEGGRGRYDTTERVRRVKQTALRLIQKRERTALRRLGTLCTALALGLTGALAHFIGGAPGAAVQGAYGATLLADSAGGYVLVGVASFTAAAVLTVVCMRLHKREKREKNNETDKEGNAS